MVSTTFTTRCTIVVLPDESVTLYWILYVPRIEELTEPVTEILEVKSPSSTSEEVAPSSVYVAPYCNVRGLSPCRLIDGGVPTTTVLIICVATLP